MEVIEREHKKIIPLAMIHILEEYTDDKHALEMSHLKELLKNLYGIDADRRTLYSTVKLLNGFGYSINYGKPYEDCLKKGYYMAGREFSEEDCVAILKAISQNENFENIKRSLLRHFSKYQRINIEDRIEE